MKIVIFRKRVIVSGLMASAILSLSLVGCSKTVDSSDGQAKESATVIMGAGSSFIYPAMSRWANEYYNTSGVKINYQPIGSGGGQRQIFAGTVNFAASDQPLDNAELNKYSLIQFPAIVGGIVPVINIAGVTSNQLVLSAQVLAEIYLGKIQYWDDSAIVALNPEIKLPHNMIITVHRADGSGTTYNFTRYLANVSPVWQKQVGVNTSVQWPVGIGAKGNQGVAAQVQQVSDSVGYVEYAYAKTANIPTVKLINQAGETVAADLNSFASAAKYASWKAADSYNMILVNQPGKESWPIVATTFILLPKDAKQVIDQEIKQFFDFAYSARGNMIAKKLDYVGIPENVVTGIKAYWTKA